VFLRSFGIRVFRTPVFGKAVFGIADCTHGCYCGMISPSVCLSVCMSVTLVHPAKAVGRNEMPFGRDTCVVPCNIVLGRGPHAPTRKGDLEVRTPQFAVVLPIAKLLWPLYGVVPELLQVLQVTKSECFGFMAVLLHTGCPSCCPANSIRVIDEQGSDTRVIPQKTQPSGKTC